ncbi:MAG: DUF2442 domain-containing protein [Bacteroidales bacterium]|nr:DUF2442 domain-containing protein [Bacteroidales bacterium]
MFLEITKATYLYDYILKITFNNGECRIFDFEKVISHYPVFAPLHDIALFKNFTVTDTLEWNNGTIDIAPEYIYEHGKAA